MPNAQIAQIQIILLIHAISLEPVICHQRRFGQSLEKPRLPDFLVIVYTASILFKYKLDRYRPDRIPVGPITVRYRIKWNANKAKFFSSPWSTVLWGQRASCENSDREQNPWTRSLFLDIHRDKIVWCATQVEAPYSLFEHPGPRPAHQQSNQASPWPSIYI